MKNISALGLVVENLSIIPALTTLLTLKQEVDFMAVKKKVDELVLMTCWELLRLSGQVGGWMGEC